MANKGLRDLQRILRSNESLWIGIIVGIVLVVFLNTFAKLILIVLALLGVLWLWNKVQG